jgi:small subunit ribosomal protein S1
VADVVSVGQTVRVKISKIDDEHHRISLSMRKAEEDPWAKAEERFRPGSIVTGTVVRHADFGAFVELAPQVEALAPASELPPVAGGWSAELPVGTSRDWLVLAVDRRRHRIAVTLPSDRGPVSLEPGSEVSGKVQRVESYGVFVWLGPGQIGLMPRVWCGLQSGETIERRFKIGDAVDVRIVDVTDKGRRIRLAARGVATEQEPAPPRAEAPRSSRPAAGSPRPESKERPREEESSSFGTSLGDKLRAAIDRRNRM